MLFIFSYTLHLQITWPQQVSTFTFSVKAKWHCLTFLWHSCAKRNKLLVFLVFTSAFSLMIRLYWVYISYFCFSFSHENILEWISLSRNVLIKVRIQINSLIHSNKHMCCCYIGVKLNGMINKNEITVKCTRKSVSLIKYFYVATSKTSVRYKNWTIEIKSIK